MEPLDAIQLTISIVLAIVTVRQANVTHKLEQRLYRLNTNLDQSIQRLHRAREAVIQEQKARVFLVTYVEAYKAEGKTETTEIYFKKRGELSAYWAELRGLAFAIQDDELLRYVNQSEDVDSPMLSEMAARAGGTSTHEDFTTT